MKLSSNTTLHSVEGTARKLGVSHQTIRNWLSREDSPIENTLKVDKRAIVLTGEQVRELEEWFENGGPKGR